MFRKHNICIDDACVGKTNFNKLNPNYYEFDKDESNKNQLNKEVDNENLLTNFKYIDEDYSSNWRNENLKLQKLYIFKLKKLSFLILGIPSRKLKLDNNELKGNQ